MAKAMSCASLLLLLGLFLVHWKGVVCLKLMRVHVPHYKIRGEMAFLECQFDMERDTLYSVKWYKDNEEFFRYVPRLKTRITSYRVEGVHVNHDLSHSKQVVLNNVNLKSAGIYKCEVNAEAPSFDSVNGQGRMTVVHLPTDGPEITGEKKEYDVGDTLDVNCTSGRSYPPAKLTWYINDYPVELTSLVEYDPQVHHNGLVTSTLGLRFPLHAQHFQGGSLKVKCAATISTVFWQGDRESVVENQQQQQQQRQLAPLIDNKEVMLLVTGAATVVRSACGLVSWFLLTLVANLATPGL